MKIITLSLRFQRRVTKQELVWITTLNIISICSNSLILPTNRNIRERKWSPLLTNLLTVKCLYGEFLHRTISTQNEIKRNLNLAFKTLQSIINSKKLLQLFLEINHCFNVANLALFKWLKYFSYLSVLVNITEKLSRIQYFKIFLAFLTTFD